MVPPLFLFGTGLVIRFDNSETFFLHKFSSYTILKAYLFTLFNVLDISFCICHKASIARRYILTNRGILSGVVVIQLLQVVSLYPVISESNSQQAFLYPYSCGSIPFLIGTHLLQNSAGSSGSSICISEADAMLLVRMISSLWRVTNTESGRLPKSGPQLSIVLGDSPVTLASSRTQAL